LRRMRPLQEDARGGGDRFGDEVNPVVWRGERPENACAAARLIQNFGANPMGARVNITI